MYLKHKVKSLEKRIRELLQDNLNSEGILSLADCLYSSFIKHNPDKDKEITLSDMEKLKEKNNGVNLISATLELCRKAKNEYQG